MENIRKQQTCNVTAHTFNELSSHGDVMTYNVELWCFFVAVRLYTLLNKHCSCQCFRIPYGPCDDTVIQDQAKFELGSSFLLWASIEPFWFHIIQITRGPSYTIILVLHWPMTNECFSHWNSQFAARLRSSKHAGHIISIRYIARSEIDCALNFFLNSRCQRK